MQHTALAVLEAALRALHPVIPFVTEEIWQQVAPRLGIEGESIARRPWPQRVGDAGVAEGDADALAGAAIAWLQSVVSGVRAFRSQMGLSPAREITLLFVGGDPGQRALVLRAAGQLRFLVRAAQLRVLDAGEPEPDGATLVAQVGEQRVLVPVAGLIDVGAELARLDKEIVRIEGEIRKAAGKLGNDTFVANAPAAVVEQERERLLRWQGQADGLRAQRARLAGA
jgi:valyl-tRNA synthetase